MNQQEQEEVNAFLKTLDIDRRKSFYHSLNKILQNVTTDPTVKQLLSTKKSSIFVTKRLEEIIYKTITNDREDYILKLGKKIHKLQKINENINNQNLREVGKQVLTISNRQNEKECEYKRTIITLKKQIKDLQQQVVQLRIQKVVEETEKNALKVDLPLRDPNDKDFLHIKRAIDITELNSQVQTLNLELMTAKKLMTTMKDQFKKDLDISKQKISLFYDAHNQKVDDLKLKFQNERNLRMETQRKYDEQIIPQFLESKKQMAEKHKEINESRLKDIEEMRSLLYKMRTEQRTNQMRVQGLENENKELKAKNSENEKLISKLRSMNNQLRDEAEDFRTTIADKDIAYRMLEEANFHMKDEISNLKNELAFSHQNEDEIAKAKETIDKEYRQFQATAQSSIEKAKTMAMEVERAIKAKERVDSKLDALNSKYEQLAYKEKEGQRQILLLKKEISQLNRKSDAEFEERNRLQETVRELETENDDLKRKIEEMEYEEQTMRIEAEDRENELEDDYQRRLNDQKASMRRMLEEKEKVEKKNESLKKHIDDHKQMIETLKRNLEKEKEDRKNVEQKRRDAEDQLSDIEKTKDALQSQVDSQKVKIAQLEQRIAIIQEEKDGLKEQIKQLK